MKRLLPLLFAACAAPQSIGSNRAALTSDDDTLVLICRIEPKETPDAGSPVLDAGAVLVDAGHPVDGGSLPAPVDAGSPTALAWSLTTSGNKILLPNGKPAQLRGANVHDPRMCNACAGKEDWAETRRKMGLAVDDWKMNFLRLVLEEPSSASQAYFDGLKATITSMRQQYPGVYIMVSLWSDAALLAPAGGSGNIGGPNANTPAFWAKVATLLRDEPNVLFGISNEPAQQPDAVVWAALKASHDAIRATENPAQRHIVVAQGVNSWGRTVAYFVGKELGPNVAYESHPYGPEAEFRTLLSVSNALPLIVGEFATGNFMTAADSEALMVYAEQRGIPYAAWTFTRACPSDLISSDATNSRCSAGTWLPSAWGRQLLNRLSKPYGTVP